MTGLTVMVSTIIITVIISLMIAVMIKVMAIVIGKFSRPEHLPVEKESGFFAVAEKAASDESDIATAIAITRYLEKPFPVNY